MTSVRDGLKDYYKILDIQPTATSLEIRKAFKQLVKIWHPDVNNSEKANDRIISIYEAYEILRDESKRAVYDRLYRDTYLKKEPEFYTNKSYYKPESGSSQNAEHNYSSKGSTSECGNSSEYEEFSQWVNNARDNAKEFVYSQLEKMDRSLETGFFIVGRLGNFIAFLFAILFLGYIGLLSSIYFYTVITGARSISILGFLLATIGILLSGASFYGFAQHDSFSDLLDDFD